MRVAPGNCKVQVSLGFEAVSLDSGMRFMQVSYHTHIPEYIPKYTWKGLVGPMWRVIRFNILMADLTLVPSKTMKVLSPYIPGFCWAMHCMERSVQAHFGA